MKRYAAIDIGSNAVRLLIADLVKSESGISFKKNTLVRVPLRLGDDAFLHQQLSERKVGDLRKAMLAFRNLMDVYHVERYMACATSAMRESRNGSDIIKAIEIEANIHIETITGQKEAAIICSGRVEEQINTQSNYLYVDVGGGSTELSLFSFGALVVSRSFDLGTIRILDHKDRTETWQELKMWIKEHTQNLKNIDGIGSGGNINKLFRLSRQKDGEPVSYNRLKSIYSQLNALSYKERVNTLGLNQDRADVIIPASEIYLTVMKHASIKQMYVPRIGLVDGIIHSLILQHSKELKEIYV